MASGGLAFQLAGACPAATHFLLRRQKKVSKEKATPLLASLRCAAGNLRCSSQPGPGSNSPTAQTIARPHPSGSVLLGASRRGVGPQVVEMHWGALSVASLLTNYVFGSCGVSGHAPDSALTFLASPRKVSKRRRAGFVGPAGTLRCSEWVGSGSNSPCGLKQSPALTHPRLRYSPPHNGARPIAEDQHPVRAMRGRAERSDGVLFQKTLLCAPRSTGASGPGLALFERSEFSQTPLGPRTAGCPVAQCRGRRQQGRFFFAYFLLAKQKKVSSRRATPGTSQAGERKC